MEGIFISPGEMREEPVMTKHRSRYQCALMLLL